MELEVLLPSRVTVVTAPAGFGKTRYLSQLRDRPGAVWVDAALDPDPVAALELALGHPARRVLVVDDAHLIRPDGRAAGILASAVRRGTAPTRIALVGRPPLPVPVSGAAVRGGLTRITESELRLGDGRIADLLEQRLGPAAVVLSERLAALTGGWPALVDLAADELVRSHGGRGPEALEACFGRGGPAIGYVEQSVLADLGRRLRSALSLTALLGAVPDDTFAAAGLDAPGTAVEELIGQRLLHRCPDDARLVALSPFLGEALARASTRPRRPTADLRRIATHFAGSEDPLRALEVLRLLADHVAVADLLDRHGADVLRAGDPDGLVAAIEALPAGLRRPRLTVLEGQARQVLGDHEGALACYRSLAGKEGELDPGLAWRMGVIHYLRGEPAEALACYHRGRLGDEQDAEEAQLLAWMASAAWLRGDAATCADCADRALAAARFCGDDSALAAAHVALALYAGLVGVRRDLNEHYDLAHEHAVRAGDRLQIVRICSNRGSHLVDEGQPERALAELEVARRTAREAGFVAFEALGAVNTGEALLRLGRLDASESAFTEARQVYQRMGSRKIAYALNGLGDVHRLRGGYGLARAAYAEALEASESGEDVQALVPALCGLARISAVDDPVAGAAYARRAIEVPGPGQPQARVVLGWLLRSEDLGKSAALARLAGADAALQRDWVTLAESQELQAVVAGNDRRLLREAELSWQQAGSTLGLARLRYARSMLTGAGSPDRAGREARMHLDRLGVWLELPQSAGLLAALPGAPGGRIEVRTLGGFTILRDGVPVAGPMMQSRKARDLFRILLARDAPVPRDELISLLWPGEDVTALSNRLAVAVRAIRRSLDPDRRRPADWVVVSSGGALRLDDRDVEVDVFHFLSDTTAALRAARGGDPAAGTALEAAVARYEGDFLAEDAYEAWAMPRRAEARTALVRCLTMLARLAEARGDAAACVSWARRALQHDPSDAEARQLVPATPPPRRHPPEARRRLP